MMRKMMSILLIMLLSGCMTQEKNQEALTEVPTLETSSYLSDERKENAIKLTFQASFVKGFDDMKLQVENCSDIVLAAVVSLDGADTIYPDGSKSIHGYTYGDFVVYDVLKGNLSMGEVVQYARNGGVITQAQYDKLRPASSLEKAKALREQNGFDEDLSELFIDTLIEGDVPIEAGKTYLMILQYDEANDLYRVIDYMYGLREVSLPQRETIPLELSEADLSGLQILNNVTGEFESYDEYLETYGLKHQSFKFHE